MWSESYRIFHEMMKDFIKDPEFVAKPLEIPQSRFDSELYKVDGKHFWEGSLIKVDSLLACLRDASANKDRYILFTDIDLIVKPGVYKALEPYMKEDYDMVFLKEDAHLNIGFLLLKPTEEVIEYWEMIRKKMIETPGLDQNYVNETIHSFSGRFTHFDENIFTCSSTWDTTTNYVVMQVLCSCLGKEFNMAEKIFTMAQNIEMQPYMQYVKPEIIPYIYEFQEYLFRSHQDLNSNIK
jgi:hypothetical protein